MDTLVGHGNAVAAEKHSRPQDQSLSPERQEIVALIAQSGSLTISSIAAKLGKNVNTTKTLIRRLQRDGIIARGAKGYILAEPAEVAASPSPSAVASPQPLPVAPVTLPVTQAIQGGGWRERVTSDRNMYPARFVADMLWQGRDFGEVLLAELEGWREATGEAVFKFAPRVGVSDVGYADWKRHKKLPPGTPSDTLWKVLAALVGHRRETAVGLLGSPRNSVVGGEVLLFDCPACSTSQLEVNVFRRLWTCGRSRCPLGARTAVYFGQKFSPSSPYPGDLLQLEAELRPYLQDVRRVEDG